MINKNRIKTLGKKLRTIQVNESLHHEDLMMLNEWRLHHVTSLKYIGALLEDLAREQGLDKSLITVTQRLKRVPSIIAKLKRFPEMQLSTMSDIAGARIILPDVTSVFKLVNSLKERSSTSEIVRLDNYIASPKSDGYRSIHLIYKIKKVPDIFIEVQLRSHLQHVWATGVEVFGTLIKTSFKFGEGSNDWKIFFKLLSSRFAIEEKYSVIHEHEIYSHATIESMLIDKIKTLNIIEQLNAYTSVFKSTWRSERPRGRNGRYALLVLNTIDHSTKVTIYGRNHIHEALKAYAEIEKTYHSSHDINAVVVNLDSLESLEKAYPNYFMDTKLLSQYLSQIVLKSFTNLHKSS